MSAADDTTNTREATPDSSPLRERLMRDAEKVSDRDIEELDTSVPEKLAGFDIAKIDEKLGWIATMIARVRTLFEMIRARDFTIDRKTKALVAAGLLYFVLPADFIPDFIPGVGYVDDALVLNMLWKIVEGEVGRYLESRERRTTDEL